MHHETSRRRTLRSSARIKSIRTPSAARFMAKPSQRFLATNKFGGKMVGAWRFELQTSCAHARRFGFHGWRERTSPRGYPFVGVPTSTPSAGSFRPARGMAARPSDGIVPNSRGLVCQRVDEDVRVLHHLIVGDENDVANVLIVDTFASRIVNAEFGSSE